MSGVKIATCCYCGTRAALVLAGSGRHELACRSCGAPLSALKQLRADHRVGRHRVMAARPRPAILPGAAPKRRKGLLRGAWEEVLDEIEDIFD